MSLLQSLRAVLFVGQMYLAMALFGLAFLPWALASREGAHTAIRLFARYIRWSARVLVGLRSEIRGPVPDGPVLIASKHQSFFDVLLLFSVLPRPRFIMKRELLWAPIVGQYALRIGCVPVRRGGRSEAVRQMMDDVAAGRSEPGQLIIYPQGTRIAPGASAPYRIGAGVLYHQLKQDCVPAATNVGLFWPRSGLQRRPGLAVLEFLPPIAPGQPVESFMTQLETVVEQRSNMLMAEAGHRPIRETGDGLD